MGSTPASEARLGVAANDTPRRLSMATTTTRPRTNARNGNGRRSPDPRLDARSPELQSFGTLRRLPIALEDDARAKSCEALNEILADSMILYALYKKHHW